MGGVSPGGSCVQCAREPGMPPWNFARSCLRYEGAARSLVLGLKFQRGFHLIPDLRRAAALTPGLASYLSGAVLVPIPLHSRRERERGFNQSRVLAEVLAPLGRGTSVECLLSRVRDTSAQTRLTRSGRHRNLKNAFAMKKERRLAYSARYILVDDVFTTGTTLRAAAHVLDEAGAHRIDTLTLTHG